MSTVRAADGVGGALEAATDALAAAGVASPRLDAELLLAQASGADPAQLRAAPEAPLAPAAGRRFGEMVRRRLRREPVAYVLGRKGFRHLDLLVDARVLIPRPETELLVELALELRPRTVLEVGTGSGAVALALADELPDVEVTATDTSAPALEVARANAERLRLGGRVEIAEGTLPRGGGFDLLLANLPYVAEAEWGELEPEIRDFEPSAALLAGPDGLAAIRALLAALCERAERAAPVTDAVGLEVGAGQASEVAALLTGAGYPRTEVRRDLAGIERVVIGRR